MPDNVLVFYGSYRATRVGIRLANFVTTELRARGAVAELIDAREVGLPILDRMYKEYPAGRRAPGDGRRLPERSARRTPSSSSSVSTIGVRSPV